MNPDASSWEAHYATDGTWGFDGPTNFFDLILPALKKKARALDLGCGAGRNAIALARAGYQVFGMDISRNALLRGLSNAGPDGTTLHTWQGDIRNMAAQGAFDVVLAYGVLNSVATIHWSKLIHWFQTLTAPSGYNVVVVFARHSDEDALAAPELLSLSEPGEILDFYRGWDVVRRDVRTLRHSHGGRAEHDHITERYLFRRPDELARTPVASVPVRNVAVVGPATIATAAKALNVELAAYERAAQRIGKWLADSERRLVCVPDRGIARYAFDAYSRGVPSKPALVLIPQHDSRFSAKNDPNWVSRLEFPYDMVEGFTWEQQPAELAKRVDAYIALGLSTGTLIELLWTKWTKQPVFLSLDLCSSLPPEIRAKLQIFELPDVDTLMQVFDKQFPAEKNRLP